MRGLGNFSVKMKLALCALSFALLAATSCTARSLQQVRQKSMFCAGPPLLPRTLRFGGAHKLVVALAGAKRSREPQLDKGSAAKQAAPC